MTSGDRSVIIKTILKIIKKYILPHQDVPVQDEWSALPRNKIKRKVIIVMSNHYDRPSVYIRSFRAHVGADGLKIEASQMMKFSQSFKPLALFVPGWPTFAAAHSNCVVTTSTLFTGLRVIMAPIMPQATSTVKKQRRQWGERVAKTKQYRTWRHITHVKRFARAGGYTL